MDVIVFLGVVAVVVYLAYKKVPAVKAKIDGFWTKD
jgi:hypothetical protein